MIQDFKSNLEKITQDFDRALATEVHTKVMTTADREENLRISGWLTSLNFVERFESIFKLHVGGTGSWFLVLDDIQDWMGEGTKSRRIWCTGAREFSLIEMQPLDLAMI